jgi:hypothetical protein
VILAPAKTSILQRIWSAAPQLVWRNNDDMNFLFFSSGRPLIDAVAI